MQPVKCVVLGDKSVGRTCLLQMFLTNHFPEDTKCPVCFTEPHFKNVMVDGKLINLQLCDTFTQDEYDLLRPLSYIDNNVFVICFSLVDPVSFERVKSKWKPEAAKHLPKVPIILVGTKLDLRDDTKASLQTISHEQGVEMSKEIGALQYIECSALLNENVDDVFKEAIRSTQRGNSRSKLCCLC